MTKGVNKTFFKNIDSEIKAYLLGFYLGDGSLSKGRLSVGVSEKDKYIVELFQRFISPNTSLYYYTPNREDYNEKPSIRFSVQHKELAESLRKFGYGERKTYLNKTLPIFNTELYPHFIRGYFDADGSISVSFAERKQGRQIGYKSLLRAFNITSKDPTILIDIQNKLSEYNIKVSVKSYKKGSILYTNNKDIIEKLYELLYSNSEFYLDRKKEMFVFTMKTSREIRELKNFNPCNA